MLEFRVIKSDDVMEVAGFISELNNIEDSHIGYCGKNVDEISYSLKEDISDIKYTESFVTAYEQGRLIGALGFDADLENNSVEIWGPFIKNNKWEIVASLWREMVKLLPENVKSINMFPNKQNYRVLSLANELGFKKHSEHTILTLSNKCIDRLKEEVTIGLTQGYFDDFIKLHNTIFPNAYYKGEQIIERLNEHRKVFIIEENASLSGYIYVEAVPEFGESSIEFLAVDESKRGKGIGGKLLSVALKWLFSFKTINEFTLCVNMENDKAIRLYENFGFTHVHDLCFLTKALK